MYKPKSTKLRYVCISHRNVFLGISKSLLNPITLISGLYLPGEFMVTNSHDDPYHYANM